MWNIGQKRFAEVFPDVSRVSLCDRVFWNGFGVGLGVFWWWGCIGFVALSFCLVVFIPALFCVLFIPLRSVLRLFLSYLRPCQREKGTGRRSIILVAFTCVVESLFSLVESCRIMLLRKDRRDVGFAMVAFGFGLGSGLRVGLGFCGLEVHGDTMRKEGWVVKGSCGFRLS